MVDKTKAAPAPAARSSVSPFQSFGDEMNRFFGAFSSPHFAWGAGGAEDGAFGLRVDIGETADEIEVKADLPGVDPKDVEVTLDGDILTLKAQKSAEADRKEKSWRVRERSYGSYARSIRLPQGIDPAKVKADFAEGVLTVTAPKPAGGKAGARIEVKSK